MGKTNSFLSGFWFSYIDALTVLASIFLILFITTFSDLVIGREKVWKYTKARIEAFNSLNLIDEISIIGNIYDGGIKITISEDILFSPSSANVKNNGIELIKEIAAVLNNTLLADTLMQKSSRIVVGGHADSTKHPSWNEIVFEEKNLFLSQRRANHVASILKNELPNINIAAVGYSHHYPKPNANNRENRRVTIVFQAILMEHIENLEKSLPPEIIQFPDEKYRRLIKSSIRDNIEDNI